MPDEHSRPFGTGSGRTMGERMCSPTTTRFEDSNPLAAGNAPGCLARAASLEKRLERLSEGTCGGGLWALASDPHGARRGRSVAASGARITGKGLGVTGDACIRPDPQKSGPDPRCSVYAVLRLPGTVYNATFSG